MPIKDSEKRRAYDRERKRRKRARQKEADVEEQIKRGNINYGLKTRREQFMTHEEYKRHFPNASFPSYLKEKITFEKENRVRSVPKISREDSFKIEGVDLWHGSEGKQEAIDAEMREGDRLEAILNEPRQQRPTERTNWREEVDRQAEDFKASQVMNQEQEQLEQEQAQNLEDKILGRRKQKQEDSEEKQGNS